MWASKLAGTGRIGRDIPRSGRRRSDPDGNAAAGVPAAATAGSDRHAQDHRADNSASIDVCSAVVTSRTSAATSFNGRLLLVTENDYRQRLFNGDIGICLRDGRGDAVAWFATGDGVHGFHPAYTAITRARTALHACGDQEILRVALARRVRRVSGLQARLAKP
jgi:hypothetical protein